MTVPLFVFVLFLVNRFLSEKTADMKKRGVSRPRPGSRGLDEVQFYGLHSRRVSHSAWHLGRTAMEVPTIRGNLRPGPSASFRAGAP